MLGYNDHVSGLSIELHTIGQQLVNKEYDNKASRAAAVIKVK